MLSDMLLATTVPVPPPPPAYRLYSWGDNQTGQTAQNTASGFTTIPTQSGLADPTVGWQQISGGGYTLFASSGNGFVGIKTDGTLWSWGPNFISNSATIDGRIAQGNITIECLVPTQIGTDADWVWCSQNLNGGCAIKSSGSAWSWGLNTTSGNLGQGATGARYYVPTQIGSGTDWAKCFVGPTMMYMIKTDGTLWVCGSNTGYQTGRGLSAGNTTTLTQIGTDTNWAYVSCKNPGNVIALKTNGTAYSWGTDGAGELFQGATGAYTTPTQIGTDTDWSFAATSVKTSSRASYMIKSDGSLWTAGSNAEYQTGLGTDAGNTLTPTRIGSDTYSTVESIGSRNSTAAAVALSADGKLYSWGSNTGYYTGLGTTTGQTQNPVQIGTLSDWINVWAAGAGFAQRY